MESSNYAMPDQEKMLLARGVAAKSHWISGYSAHVK